MTVLFLRATFFTFKTFLVFLTAFFAIFPPFLVYYALYEIYLSSIFFNLILRIRFWYTVLEWIPSQR